MLLSMQHHFGETTVSEARAVLYAGKPREIRLRKPRFGKVGKLNPESRSVNLFLKVVKKGEDDDCVVVGDATGIINLSIRGKDPSITGALATAGSKLIFRNGRIIMVKGFMWLHADK